MCFLLYILQKYCVCYDSCLVDFLKNEGTELNFRCSISSLKKIFTVLICLIMQQGAPKGTTYIHRDSQ